MCEMGESERLREFASDCEIDNLRQLAVSYGYEVFGSEQDYLFFEKVVVSVKIRADVRWKMARFCSPHQMAVKLRLSAITFDVRENKIKC